MLGFVMLLAEVIVLNLDVTLSFNNLYIACGSYLKYM